MKTILCYGDSNTWGAIPRRSINDIRRYPYNERWTGILSKELGNDFHIIEEGLRGRTTVFDDPVEGKHKNGYSYLLPCLESHYPIDLVILFLGINDFKKRFSASVSDVKSGIKDLVLLIKKSKTGKYGMSPDILILSPPPIRRTLLFKDLFKGAKNKTERIGEHFASLALELNCKFIDTSDFIKLSDIDGIHLEKKYHLLIGKKIAKLIHGFDKENNK